MTKRQDELSVVTFQRDNMTIPAGIKRTEFIGPSDSVRYFYPAITDAAYNNLYGRIMTLLEATTDQHKLKVVKTLFQRELNDYFDNLEKSVKELDDETHVDGHGYYYKNVYVYGNGMGRAVRGDHPELNDIDI